MTYLHRSVFPYRSPLDLHYYSTEGKWFSIKRVDDGYGYVLISVCAVCMCVCEYSSKVNVIYLFNLKWCIYGRRLRDRQNFLCSATCKLVSNQASHDKGRDGIIYFTLRARWKWCNGGTWKARVIKGELNEAFTLLLDVNIFVS